MGHFAGIVRSATMAFFGAFFAIAALTISLGFAGVDTAAAASKAKSKAAAAAAPASEADQAKQNSDQSRRAYDAGIKSYSASKYQPAVDELSGALRGGGLGSAEMAKALYVRGLAYKKLSKPGLAISDLTSALWLKNGLGESDQKNAISERAEAYRLAGLGDGNSGAESVAVANPNPAPAGAKAAAPTPAAPVAASETPAPAKSKKKMPPAAAVAPPVAAPAVTEVTRQSPDSQSARDAANARKLASMPIETGGLQSAAAGSLVTDNARVSALDASKVAASAAVSVPAAAAPVALATPVIPAPIPTAAAAPAVDAAPVLSAAPIETAAAPATGAGLALPKSVTGFFSNMFGSTAKPAEAQAATAPLTTASTSPALTPSSAMDAPLVAGQKAASGKAVQQAGSPPVQTAAAAQPKGKYKIHIAAVRSRAEAEALAQKLASQNGTALKNRTPVVDEAVIGSMGTFYRVRVGSYATADEPRGVCNTLRTSGFDCLVVTN